MQCAFIIVMSRDRHDILNHQQLRLTTNKSWNLHITGPCDGNPWISSETPYKILAMQKVFPCHDIIMWQIGLLMMKDERIENYWDPLHINTIFSETVLSLWYVFLFWSIIKIKWPWNYYTFIMEIHVPVRQHIPIETAPKCSLLMPQICNWTCSPTN